MNVVFSTLPPRGPATLFGLVGLANPAASWGQCSATERAPVSKICDTNASTIGVKVAINKLHTNSEPWIAIKRAVAGTKQQVVVAVAYIGSDAPRLLPLKRGDILVCDASEASIKSRTTSADALRTFHNRGVKIYSREGLHSKIVVLADRVFVGSANASRHSEQDLDEVMLETVNKAVVKQSRSYVMDLVKDFRRVGKADLLKLNDIPLSRLSRLPRKQDPPEHVPEQVDRLWVILTSYEEEWNTSTSAQYKVELSDVREEARDSFGQVPISALEWRLDELTSIKPGDWLIEVVDGRSVESPAQILKASPVGRSKQALMWFVRPRTGRKRIRASVLTACYPKVDNPPDSQLWQVRSASMRKTLLGLFQE